MKGYMDLQSFPQKRLKNCYVGLFLFGDTLCVKTEYMTKSADGRCYSDCYICSTGECFWGGTHSFEERDNLMVYPIEIKLKIKEDEI